MDEHFYHPSRLKVDVMTLSNIGVQMIDGIESSTYINLTCLLTRYLLLVHLKWQPSIDV